MIFRKHVSAYFSLAEQQTIPVKPKSLKKVKKVHQSVLPAWLSSFPTQLALTAALLFLLYLLAPESLHKMLDFSFRISEDLNYVDGAPPV